MMSQVNGHIITPPADRDGFLTRDEQTHYTDDDRREQRRELARSRARGRK